MKMTRTKRESRNAPPRMRISAAHVAAASRAPSSFSTVFINMDVATCNRQRMNSHALSTQAGGHLSKCVLDSKGETIWVDTKKRVIGLLWNGVNEDSKHLRDRRQINMRMQGNPICDSGSNGEYAALSKEFFARNKGANYNLVRCSTDLTGNTVRHVWVEDDIVLGGAI